MLVTPEVSHTPMSSLKDEDDKTQSSKDEYWSIHDWRTQNKYDISVTLPVAHVEMWPYVVSVDALFESHAATAVLMLLSSMT